jgi:hypothetical protein
VTVRSLTLCETLRRFCLGAFAVLAHDAETGAELEFAFEEHRSPGRPPLYEYRPLARAFVEARAAAIASLEDTRIAVDDLARLPQAALFARAHAEPAPSADERLLHSVLLPLVTKCVERCGGLDWDDRVFERVYAELEQSLFSERRAYAAIAPLVGVSAGAEVPLGGGLRVRAAAPGELATHWPEAAGLLPPTFGREPDSLLVLELEQPLAAEASEPPDAPGELADCVTALRLSTAGGLAAGPVLFERLDWRPYGVRPLLPVAAARPPGEPVRLDPVRARVTRDVLSRLATVDGDPELAEALDRWELSLFQASSLRADSLRDVVERALGNGDGSFAALLRAAVLLGESGGERRDLLAELRGLGAGGDATAAAAADSVRRALVEILLHGNRAALIQALDESLLGLRPRPTAAPGRSAVAV